LLLFSGSYSNDGKWKIEIELEKENYVLYENIVLDISITNRTDDTLATYGLLAPNHRQFTIELKNESGNLVEYSGPKILMASTPPDLKIEPNGQDYGSFNLLNLFHTNENFSGYKMQHGIHHITPGTYYVRVYYEDSESEEISFNILEPSGEDKEVLKLIEDASRIWKQSNPYPSGQIFQEIVDKYPNTVYMELCYYKARHYSPEVWGSRKNGTFDKEDFEKDLLEKCPNSGYSKVRIIFLTKKLSDSAKLEFLNSISSKAPNTRSDRYIQILLSRITKKNESE
jgi:hypothetical protein